MPENPAEMIGKSPNQNQRNLFRPVLKEFINPDHDLVLLAHKFPWKEIEDEFVSLYSHTGSPAKPIRLMVGLLLLKRIYNLGDETLLPQWVQNPYFQYFCGESEFQWQFPCDPSDLVHFRNRIGKDGVEKIFKASVKIQNKPVAKTKEVIVDSTAQEKNVTFPTDSKLYRKIIEGCNQIADKNDIQLRQSYRRTVKKLMIQQRFGHHPKRKKEAERARRKLKTIAGRQVRDLERNLSRIALFVYGPRLERYKSVVNQKRSDKNKIYSLHEPDVSCIAKGKAHKKFEFGSKVSVAMLPGSNVIVGVVNFQGNPHDSKTLQATLDHCEKITGKTFERAILDRGYRRQKENWRYQPTCSGRNKGKNTL